MVWDYLADLIITSGKMQHFEVKMYFFSIIVSIPFAFSLFKHLMSPVPTSSEEGQSLW